MRFLCSERGLQYEPPSKFLLDVLDVPTAEVSSMKRHSLQADVIALHVCTYITNYYKPVPLMLLFFQTVYLVV